MDNYQALDTALTESKKRGVDLTEVLDAGGNTLMHACAQRGSVNCLQVVAKHARPLVSQRHKTSSVEPLHLAIGSGMVNTVHCLLSANADPNSLCFDRNVGRMSALCGAVSKRNSPMISILLKAGARIDALSLCIAVRYNQIGVVSILLEHCNNTESTELLNLQLTKQESAMLQVATGSTPLITAILYGLHDVAAMLLRAGANPEQPDGLGRRPFHAAASRDNVMLMRALLAHNVKVDATRSSDAWNAMHFAAEANAFQATTFLLQLGFPVHACANNLANTLHIACFNKSSSVVQALISAKAELDRQMERGWTALAIACKNGDLTTATSLLKARASVNPSEPNVPSPLFQSIIPNNDAIVEALLLCKAHPNLPNAQGVPPLFLAASKGYTGIVQHLLAKRAEPELGPGDTKVTPLMQASAFNHLQIAQMLLLAKANVSCVSKTNLTPVFLAIKERNARGLSVLLSFKANPNNTVPLPANAKLASEATVSTPLMVCVSHNFAAGCAVLLQAKANANHVQPTTGSTALHVAVERGREDCCNALASRTNGSIKDKKGRTPVDIAKQMNATGLAKVLTRPQEAVEALAKLVTRIRQQDVQSQSQKLQEQPPALAQQQAFHPQQPTGGFAQQPMQPMQPMVGGVGPPVALGTRPGGLGMPMQRGIIQPMRAMQPIQQMGSMQPMQPTMGFPSQVGGHSAPAPAQGGGFNIVSFPRPGNT